MKKPPHPTLAGSWIESTQVGFGMTQWTLWVKYFAGPVGFLWFQASGNGKAGNMAMLFDIYVPEWCRRRGYAFHLLREFRKAHSVLHTGIGTKYGAALAKAIDWEWNPKACLRIMKGTFKRGKP